MDSLAFHYQQKELTELDVAKSFYNLRLLKAEASKQEVLYKKYIAFLKKENNKLNKMIVDSISLKDTISVK